MTTTKAFTITLLLTASLMATLTSVQSVEPIWLSPRLVGNYWGEFKELGVWTNISVGAGSRFQTPTVAMDSKKTLWLLFGYRLDSGFVEYNVWNYDPQTDLYRWVAGPGNSTINPRNAGTLQVPSLDNHPGGVIGNPGSIDHNDNIWFMTTQYVGELWMFNTTSHYFTRMKGSYPNALAAVYGTLGQPGDNVLPGQTNGGCLVVDSFNNLWQIGGQTSDGIQNRVWHFNTTSYQWTFFGGNMNTSQVETVYDNDPLYGARAYQGCDIDSNDRVWLFGGQSSTLRYNDVWSYDTRTLQWQLEFGSNDSTRAIATVTVTNDFDAGNHPATPDSTSLIADRKDGTLLLVNSQGRTNIWLFHKTLKQWKLVYGDPFNPNQAGNFSNYRTPGSVMPGYLKYFGMAYGLNIEGDVFIYGGTGLSTTSILTYNSIWLISQDQCSTSTSNNCSSNARCIELDVGYSCECNTGFTGDGFSCEGPPSMASPLSSTTPLSLSQPSSTQVSSGVAVKSSLLFIILSVGVFTLGLL